MKIQENCVKLYECIDNYVPLACMITSTIDLIAKGVFKCCPPDEILPGSFSAHVVNKSVAKCLAFIFIPLSNIAFAIYNNTRNKQNFIESLFTDSRTFKSLPQIDSSFILGRAKDFPAIRYEYMSAPIMRGKDRYNRELMALATIVKVPATKFQDLGPVFINWLPKDAEGNIIDRRVYIFFQRFSNNTTDRQTSFLGFAWKDFPLDSFTFHIENGPKSDEEKACVQDLKTFIQTGRLESNGFILELKADQTS